MPKIWIGPTGQTVRGGVLDVSKTALEQKLRDYDSLLYIKWNAKKRAGRGCWEVRRRPEKKCVTEVVNWGGLSICRVEYKELDIVNHVLDLDVLHYNALTKIKEMDTFKDGHQNWIREFHAKEKEHEAEVSRKAREDMIYGMKQSKREIKEFRELVQSGFNPALIFSGNHWK